MLSRAMPHQSSPLSRLARAAVLAPLWMLAACASTRERSTLPDDAPRPRILAAGPRDPITEAEIARIDAADTYDLVHRLRGGFLGSRGMTTFQRPDGGAFPAVLVDGMWLGTIAELHGIPANTVHEVRFLSAGDAMLRYGPGYAAGVIQVTTRR